MPKKTQKQAEFKPFWTFQALAAGENGAKSCEMLLYGTFDDSSWAAYYDDSIISKAFAEALNAQELTANDKLNVRINSLGGDVFAAMAIYSQLLSCPAEKTCIVDGAMASAATIPACACNKIQMHAGSMGLVHHASGWGMGNAADLRKTADDLAKIDDALVALYIKKSGVDEADIRAQMDDGGWMTAQQCLELGLCDEIIPGEVAAEETADDPLVWNIAGQIFDMTNIAIRPTAMLKTAPRAEADPIVPPAPAPSAAVSSPAADTPIMPTTAETVHAAVATERTRIKAIQDMAEPGAEAIITAAIDSGAQPGDVAQQILAASRERRLLLENHAARIADAADAGLPKISPSAAPENEQPGAEKQAKREGFLAVAAAALKKLGRLNTEN